MSFPTIEFAAFFVVVFVLSWALMPHPSAWRPFILVGVVLLLRLDRLALGAAADRVQRRQHGGSAGDRAHPVRGHPQARADRGVAFDLGLLAVFKYLSFFVSETDNALDSIGLGSSLPLVQIVLPIGISFFTFQAISYVVDVYRGETPRRLARRRGDPPGVLPAPRGRADRPRERAAPAAAHPARPARRAGRAGALPDRRRPDQEDGDRGRAGAATWSTRSSTTRPRTPGPRSLLAFYAFAAQIYCDFSGYTDMAIGLALLLGFQLPQNFNRPYLALSPPGLLAALAHDAVALAARLPLHPARRQPRRPRLKTYRNLMITMLLGGLWHGASWTFVLWGGIHGAGLSARALEPGALRRASAFLRGSPGS